MQIFFIIFLVVCSIACILIKFWIFEVFYKPWLDHTLLELDAQQKDKPMNEKTKIEVKKEDEL